MVHNAGFLINMLASDVHAANKKWWHDPVTGERLHRNVGEMLMLVTSELAEALEGHRKGLRDSHLPTRSALEVELADALIRLFDVAVGLDLDLGGAYVEKMAYNAVRADHKLEARLAAGGKKY
jgi:NTP pyrophosphatase (non-canonical NTP hydrolase)